MTYAHDHCENQASSAAAPAAVPAQSPCAHLRGRAARRRRAPPFPGRGAARRRARQRARADPADGLQRLERVRLQRLRVPDQVHRQAMHTNGMQTAGYTYVNIDDCWMTHSRDSGGHLVPDPAKFPDGIKGTADYVHSLGLKLGIYEDAGTATCAGYPGSLGHESTDAQSFASWGVDYLKYDNCNNNGVSAQSRYTAMRDALAATNRPILYSLCNWGQDNVWTWGAGVGNSWRTTGDITANFASMLSIFHINVGLASYAGPGHWNDPDMLEVGNGSMTATEGRSEFSLWAEMAAPLIAGTNIPSASAETLSTLTNSRVIAVDQDPLGKQGTMVSSSGGRDVLAKPLANGDVSVALFNETGSTATISTTAAAIGKTGASAYTLTDLWSGASSTTSG